jgi:hypothetical protein
MESIIEGVDFQKLAKDQLTYLLDESLEMRQEISKSMASMYNMDDIDMLLADPKCSKCGNAATQRCSRCKGEWYCGRPCQVQSWKTHKAICDILTEK